MISLNLNKTIRKSVSSLLLVVFALSVAPKTYFHEVLANHHDTYQTCTDHLKGSHLHQTGINCHFDQLVVNSAFTCIVHNLPVRQVTQFICRHEEKKRIYLPQPSSTRESRGPPCLA